MDNGDPLASWKISPDEEWEQTEWINSRPAWRQFEDFFASHGYNLCFHDITEPKEPLVDYCQGLSESKHKQSQKFEHNSKSIFLHRTTYLLIALASASSS